MNDVRAAMNDPQTRRITRRRAAETMTRIHEDDPLSEEDRRPVKQDIRASKRRKVVERETKPGYCENCREKYEDFNDVSLLCAFQKNYTNRFTARGNSNPQEVRTNERQLERTGCPSQAPCSTIACNLSLLNLSTSVQSTIALAGVLLSFRLYPFLRCLIRCRGGSHDYIIYPCHEHLHGSVFRRAFPLPSALVVWFFLFFVFGCIALYGVWDIMAAAFHRAYHLLRKGEEEGRDSMLLMATERKVSKDEEAE